MSPASLGPLWVLPPIEQLSIKLIKEKGQGRRITDIIAVNTAVTEAQACTLRSLELILKLVLLQVSRECLQLTPAVHAPACIRIYLKEVHTHKNTAFKKSSVERKPIRKALESKQRLSSVHPLNNSVEEQQREVIHGLK